jgi:hypothetical protein
LIEVRYRRNANATIQCPIEQGDYTVVETVALPKEIPQGAHKSMYSIVKPVTESFAAKFTVNVNGYTVDDDDMLCLNLNVDFMKKFPRFGW